MNGFAYIWLTVRTPHFDFGNVHACGDGFYEAYYVWIFGVWPYPMGNIFLHGCAVARRWFTFRRSMHGEVLMCRDQAHRGNGSLHDGCATSAG